MTSRSWIPYAALLVDFRGVWGLLFLVMALSRGKASIVAPTTNALAPVLTVLISLAV
jgi:uncharacterized membrane protein